jgi:iron(III) transport system permease protein
MTRPDDRINFFKFAMWAICFLVCAGILYALGMLLWGSFKVEKFAQPTLYSVENYIHAFTDKRVLGSLVSTLWVSLGVACLATIGGVFLAWAAARTDYPFREKLETFNLLPFFLSPLVMSVAWICLAAPRVGILNSFFQHLLHLQNHPFNVYSFWGIIWVMSIFYIPYMYLFTVGSLRKMDPALEEVARTCGSKLSTTIRKITIPLITPSIFFGFVMVFIMSAGMFAVPATLGLPVQKEVLATQIYEVVLRYPGDYNLGAAISSQLIIIIIIALLIQQKIIMRKQYFTVTGKGYRPHSLDLGNWKYLILIINFVYLFIAAVLPVGTLFLVSLHQPWTGSFDYSRLSFVNYFFIFEEIPMVLRGIKNSLMIGSTTAGAIIFFSIIIAYTCYRMKPRGHRIIDFIASLPIAIPGLVMSMGVLIGYIGTPLYNTLGIIIIAYICRFLPLGLKAVTPVLLSIHPELDESSRVSGASTWITLKRILMPLLWPGMVAGWVMLFIIFVKEINTSILLVSPENEVTGYVLYYLLEDRLINTTAAFAMIETFIILTCVFFFLKVFGKRGMEL